MPLLPRYHRHAQRLEDARRVERAILKADDGGEPPVTSSTRQKSGSTLAGDERRLRGLPAVGRGVEGAVAGTNPLGALLAKENRRR